uniref:Uncharacterized protein n=1 Tax=Ornithorhynchus anatinus TaxID=9258 RepID=A0A6I8PKL0_ORNAN
GWGRGTGIDPGPAAPPPAPVRPFHLPGTSPSFSLRSRSVFDGLEGPADRLPQAGAGGAGGRRRLPEEARPGGRARRGAPRTGGGRGRGPGPGGRRGAGEGAALGGWDRGLLSREQEEEPWAFPRQGRRRGRRRLSRPLPRRWGPPAAGTPASSRKRGSRSLARAADPVRLSPWRQ